MTVRHEGERGWSHDNPITPSYARDEGRPLGTGLQGQVSNYLKLHGSRVRVVSVQDKAGIRLSGAGWKDERK